MADPADTQGSAVRRPELPGEPFGHYVRGRVLGKGAFGTVHLAWDSRLGRDVALKILKVNDPEERERFKREARLAAGLSHPNVAAVYEVGDVGDEHYIAMQRIDGETLHRLRLTPEEALAAVRDAARAVAYAHEKGVIHRDLKPANLMRDESGRIFVLDFGLAKSLKAEQSLSGSGEAVGTPFYMSPEQARGDVRAVDARSDVWALGVTLYELVTGRRPFEGAGTLDVLRGILDDEPAPPRRIDPRLDADIETIVLKALEKEPERRYASASALADDIDRRLAGEPIEAHPPSGWYRFSKWAAKRRTVLGVAAAGALAAAVVGGIFASKWIVEARALAAKEAELAAANEATLRDLAARERARPYFDEGRREAEALRALSRRRDLDRERIAHHERESLRLFEAALREYPGHPETCLELARLHHELGRTAEAIEWCGRAIESSGGYSTAYLERALIRLERYEVLRHDEGGNSTEETAAARELRLAVESDLRSVGRLSENQAEMKYAMAVMDFADGRFEIAAPEIEAYARRRGTDEWAWDLAGHAWGHVRGREADAIRNYDEVVRLNPRAAGAYIGRGDARETQGDYDGAIAEYDEAIRIDPGNVAAYGNRGIARQQKGDLGGALDDYNKAIRLLPLAQFYVNRGGTLADLGDMDSAMADFDAAIRTNPRFAGGHYHRGRARSIMGDKRGGIADLDEAIRLDPGYADSYVSRGAAKMDLEEFDAAIADFDLALANGALKAETITNRGIARWRKGDLEGAIRDFSDSIELRPDWGPPY